MTDRLDKAIDSVEQFIGQSGTELDMLREFYRSWTALHLIPKDRLHRHKQEAAAQLLVDNAHVLRLFYVGTQTFAESPKLEIVRG